MNFILYGPPGSGKGTQAHLFATRKKFFHLSTGDLLRQSVMTHSPLGQEAQKSMKKGELVPNPVVIGLMQEEIKKTKASNLNHRGFLFDGFPRTLVQAEELDRILKEEKEKLQMLVTLKVPNQELVRRLAGRRICETCSRVFHIMEHSETCPHCNTTLKKRTDDNKEAIEKRLQVYEKSTKSLIDFYEKSQTSIHEINGKGSVEEIYLRLSNLFP